MWFRSKAIGNSGSGIRGNWGSLNSRSGIPGNFKGSGLSKTICEIFLTKYSKIRLICFCNLYHKSTVICTSHMHTLQGQPDWPYPTSTTVQWFSLYSNEVGSLTLCYVALRYVSIFDVWFLSRVSVDNWCSNSVCLSVCPSVTFRCLLNTSS